MELVAISISVPRPDIYRHGSLLWKRLQRGTGARRWNMQHVCVAEKRPQRMGQFPAKPKPGRSNAGQFIPIFFSCCSWATCNDLWESGFPDQLPFSQCYIYGRTRSRIILCFQGLHVDHVSDSNHNFCLAWFQGIMCTFQPRLSDWLDRRSP